jgi:hypothetical protein
VREVPDPCAGADLYFTIDDGAGVHEKFPGHVTP